MSRNFAIAWADLMFTVQSILSKVDKNIVDNISGSVEFESITGLMRSNGSGKTILLQCLN